MTRAILILSFLFSSNAMAFPEMVRHGYASCTVCHVSPTGGGVLTDYGRQLSSEVLSTWSREGEEKFAYSFTNPEWLKLGGDIRSVQTYRDNSKVREAQFIWMQSDLEFAVSQGPVSVVATLGTTEFPEDGPKRTAFISRRHYALVQASREISVRSGRFLPQFGLNLAEHNFLIRRGLNFNDQGMETYNLEGAWLTKEYGFYATGIFGRIDKPELNRDRNISTQRYSLDFSKTVFENSKLGLSFYSGKDLGFTRTILAPYGILGFSKRFFTLLEVDYQKSDVTSLANFLRVNFEVIQGLHFFIVQECLQSDTQNGDTVTNLGPGVQFFPRPHIDIEALYEKQQVKASGNSTWNDYAWLMLHFYL